MLLPQTYTLSLSNHTLPTHSHPTHTLPTHSHPTNSHPTHTHPTRTLPSTHTLQLPPLTKRVAATESNTTNEHILLKGLQEDIATFTNAFLHAYQGDVLLLTQGGDPSDKKGRSSGGIKRRRSRRQVVTPDMATLQGGYTNFFRAAASRTPQNRRKGQAESNQETDLPVVLVPTEDKTECVASSHLSTFGFLGFVLNIINAVMNVANNINNNDNSNNDNNNNNNNNELNTNQASITQTSTNTNTASAMVMAPRRLEYLKQMRASVYRSLRNLRTHAAARHSDSRRRRRSPRMASSCGVEGDVGYVSDTISYEHVQNNIEMKEKKGRSSSCKNKTKHSRNTDDQRHTVSKDDDNSRDTHVGESSNFKDIDHRDSNDTRELDNIGGIDSNNIRETTEKANDNLYNIEDTENIIDEETILKSNTENDEDASGPMDEYEEYPTDKIATDDMVDEALLASVLLLDLWREVTVEEDPWEMGRHMCRASAALAATSRLAAMVGEVGIAAAAHTLVNFQGVNPEFLLEAAERGAAGADCEEEYSPCVE